jgi:hypothetical protein
MLKNSPKDAILDESFEELSREYVLPIPEQVPEKPMVPSKNSSVDIMMPLIITNTPVEGSFKTISPSKSFHDVSVSKISSPGGKLFVSRIPHVKSRGSSKSPGFKSYRESSNTRITILKSQKSELDLNFNKSTGSTNYKFKVQNIENRSNCESLHQKSTERMGNMINRSQYKAP